MTKLKNLLSEVFDEQPKVNRHEVIEGVKSYGKVGQSLFNNSNLMEVAEQLSKVAESAHTHILGEQDDWFDKVSVNKNMNFLKGSVKEFKKTASEAHNLNQRLQGLYEDIGHVLNRYYDIDENVMQEDTGKDWDKDGIDEPDSEEYLDLKDKAIKANMGEGEQLDEIPSVLRLPAKAAGEAFKRLTGDGKTYIKDFPIGSQERAAEYEKRDWAPDETVPELGWVREPADAPMQRASLIDRLRAAQKAGVAVDTTAEEIEELRAQYHESLKKESNKIVEETADAKLLRLAGITKEAVAKARPTKRLADITDGNVVTSAPVGKIHKKW